MNENIFDKLDFGPLRPLLDNDDISDISYDNGGQIWVRSLTQGAIRVEVEGITPEFIEKLAFQCSNVMGTTFNNSKPFLDVESAELRMNFVHESIATNGIALMIKKIPVEIRMQEQKLLDEEYFTKDIHDFLVKCIQAHCNIIVSGDTGSGRTEFVKYLASHTEANEKIVTIEESLELHLDKIFPQRNIVSMKTNNIASYNSVLATSMRQKPDWIILSELKNAESVLALKDAISSGYSVLSTAISNHATSVPKNLYGKLDTNLDINQFLTMMHTYLQLSVHVNAYFNQEKNKYHHEVDEVTEFYVDENNKPCSRVIYKKLYGKAPSMIKPSENLLEILANKNIDVTEIINKLPEEMTIKEADEEQKNIQATGSESTSFAFSTEESKTEDDQASTPEVSQSLDAEIELTPTELPTIQEPASEPLEIKANSILEQASVETSPVIEQDQTPLEINPVWEQPQVEMPTIQEPASAPLGVSTNPVLEQPSIEISPVINQEPITMEQNPIEIQPITGSQLAPLDVPQAPVLEQPQVEMTYDIVPEQSSTVPVETTMTEDLSMPVAIAPSATPAVTIEPIIETIPQPEISI